MKDALIHSKVTFENILSQWKTLNKKQREEIQSNIDYLNEQLILHNVSGTLQDDPLHFAEWMDIVCIRHNRFKWKYKADNYTKIYTTKEMFNEWLRLTSNDR